MKVGKAQKYQFSNSSEWRRNLEVQAKVIPIFHHFHELGKNIRPTFKNPNSEFNDELKNAIFKFEFHCRKLMEFTYI